MKPIHERQLLYAWKRYGDVLSFELPGAYLGHTRSISQFPATDERPTSYRPYGDHHNLVPALLVLLQTKIADRRFAYDTEIENEP